MGHQGGTAALVCRLTPHSRLELDTRCVSEAQECTGPSRDRVLVSHIFADQDWQGVAVAEDEFPPKPLLRRNGISKRVPVSVIGMSVSSPTVHSRITGRS